MRIHSAALILAALAVAGCKTAPPHRIVVPEIVTVPVREYVAVPADLTRECAISRAEQRTVQAVVAAYNDNVVALTQCNRQLRLIRALEADAP